MMHESLRKKILYTFLLCTLTIISGTVTADDTEIYFNSTANNPAVRPNVLLILDTSGSMAWGTTSTSSRPSRMAQMQSALDTILDSLEGVNIGLMRFNGDSGASVLFPIAYINDPVSNYVSEKDTTQATYNYTLGDDNSDAQELVSSGAVTLIDSSMTVPQIAATYVNGTIAKPVGASTDDGWEYSGNISVTDPIDWFYNSGTFIQGFRFSGLAIPNGATINSASLDLYAYNTTTGTAKVDIYGEDADDSLAFDGSNNVDISTRTLTDGTGGLAGVVAWDPVPTPTATGQKITTPDLSPLIQEIINRPGWTSGNALSLIVPQNIGSRQFYSFDGAAGNTSLYPTLNVDYTYLAAPAQDKITAYHYTNVQIPQGAKITSATLTFTTTSDASGDGATWTIQADDSDNSAAITSTNGDLSSRTKTSAKTIWTLPNFTNGQTYTTCTDGSCVDEGGSSAADITNVVQAVVDRGGWCGGNDMTFLITGTGSRTIVTHEQSATNAPALSITYDKTAGGGCYKDSIVAQVVNSSDDAEENSSGTTYTNNSTINMSSNTDGFRFDNIQIPQGATITSATVSVRESICSWRRCSSQTSGAPTVSVKGELIDNSPAFTGGRRNHNITNRTTTAASVNWSLGDFTSDGTWVTSPDISSVITEIVSQGTWASGNAMSLIIGSDNQARSIDATDGSGSAGAAMLNITFTSTAGATQAKTVRERLKELISQMPADGTTPIVEALYEATHYWRGESVVHGLARGSASTGFFGGGNRTTTRISHPASYCVSETSCPGADVTNYPPYGINEPAGCSTDNLNDTNCSNRQIEGSPDYISPFKSDLTCVSNYQVLLTDGEATDNDDALTIRNEYLGGASCQSTFSNGSSVSSDEKCGVDIVKFLHDKDQSSTLDNDQTVNTYTIGFTLSTQFLKDMATAGGGTFSQAGNETDLINTFNTILTNVRDDPTSFVSPSLATNAFNRLLSRDEVYFGLFTPSMNQSWDGNVKKYNICVNSGGPDENLTTTADNCTLGEILDANSNPAIDPATNKFSSTAESEWTGQVDGLQTTFGGAGGEMTDYTQRVIYTDATTGGSEPASGTALDSTVSGDSFKLTTGTWDASTTSQIRDLLCTVNSTNTSTTDGQNCQDHIFWLLGKIINPDPTTDVSATDRWAFNDVLHSSPAVITYGGNASTNTYYDKIVVGTNEGAIRFINGSTGKEEWAFIPQELMPALQDHYDNVEGDHLYGMDVTPTIRVIDVNQDGIIDPNYDNNGDGTHQAGEGDKVYLYMAMRRGGNSIYALDVTPSATITNNNTTIVPKFLWRIQGGTGDFTRLTNTWSQPRLATIGVISGSATVEKQVLIFGGGYDDTLDSLDNSGAGPNYNFGLEGGKPNDGNAVYIVDADTGALIFSISNAADSSLGIAASGADIEVPGMNYSIPSRITTLDTTGDGLVNRLYFGDTAGQVWRVDLSNVKTGGSGNEGDTVVGRLANLSTAGTPTEERRFFTPPAVTQVRDTIYSDISGGEYDYVMIGSGNRAHPLNSDVHDRFYALRDKFPDAMPVASAGDHVADVTQYPNGASGVITNTNLIDVTNRVLDSSNTSDLASLGWYIDFNTMGTTGEKVLSAPTAIAGQALFTTYEPSVTSADPCTANIGGGYAYNVNILSAKAPQIDWDQDGSLDDVKDRKLTLGGGIPSDVVPVFTKEGVVGIVGIEGGAAQLGTLSGLPRYRTYWYQEK